MGFESLLGNERLKDNLTAAIGSGRSSHFYLISGPAGSGKRTLARLLGAALHCREQHKPCLRCNACRKVMNDAHPDFITVTDPEHKAVAVKIVRQVREEMFIHPNESDRKIYVFPQELNTEGQNALLKILEEPPAYGVFLLLTDNPEKVLTTVRSRSVELALTALPQGILYERLREAFPEAEEQSVRAAMVRSGGYLGQAMELLQEGIALSPQTEGFVKSFATGDPLELLYTLVPMEKWSREQLLEELNQWVTVLQSAVLCRSGMPVASPQALAVARPMRRPVKLPGPMHTAKE